MMDRIIISYNQNWQREEGKIKRGERKTKERLAQHNTSTITLEKGEYSTVRGYHQTWTLRGVPSALDYIALPYFVAQCRRTSRARRSIEGGRCGRWNLQLSSWQLCWGTDTASALPPHRRSMSSARTKTALRAPTSPTYLPQMQPPQVCSAVLVEQKSTLTAA